MVTFNPKTIPGLMYLKQDNGSYSFYLEVHRSIKYWVESWKYFVRLSITYSSTEMINRARSLRITGLVTASSTLSLLRSAVSLSGTTTTTLQFQPAGQRSSCPSTRKLITNWCNWRKRFSKILPVARIPAITSSTRSHTLVKVFMIISVILWYLQLASDPFISFVEKESSLKIHFGNSLIMMEEEVYNFELVDLVADCGGILGLFVGFNFLMVWDFLVSVVKKIKEYIGNKI